MANRIEFSKETEKKASTARGKIRTSVRNMFADTFSSVMQVITADWVDCRDNHNSLLELDMYLTGGEHESRINRLIPLCIERGAIATAVSPVIRCIKYGVRRNEDFDALVAHYGDVIKLANAVKAYSSLFALHSQLSRVGLLVFADKKSRSTSMAEFAQSARASVTSKEEVHDGVRKLLILAGMPETVSTEFAIERIKDRLRSLQAAKVKNIKTATKPLTWADFVPQAAAAAAGN